jgi:dimethylargininase
MTKRSTPIDLELAKQQHAAYVSVLKGLVEEIIELPADNSLPDCPFVEDTAVEIGSKALVTCPGAPLRRGEVAVVRDALLNLGVQISEAKSPSLIDGGDVLYTGGMLFVGMSKRTNEGGVKALATTFAGFLLFQLKFHKACI